MSQKRKKKPLDSETKQKLQEIKNYIDGKKKPKYLKEDWASIRVDRMLSRLVSLEEPLAKQYVYLLISVGDENSNTFANYNNRPRYWLQKRNGLNILVQQYYGIYCPNTGNSSNEKYQKRKEDIKTLIKACFKKHGLFQNVAEDGLEIDVVLAHEPTVLGFTPRWQRTIKEKYKSTLQTEQTQDAKAQNLDVKKLLAEERQHIPEGTVDFQAFKEEQLSKLVSLLSMIGKVILWLFIMIPCKIFFRLPLKLLYYVGLVLQLPERNFNKLWPKLKKLPKNIMNRVNPKPDPEILSVARGNHSGRNQASSSSDPLANMEEMLDSPPKKISDYPETTFTDESNAPISSHHHQIIEALLNGDVPESRIKEWKAFIKKQDNTKGIHENSHSADTAVDNAFFTKTGNEDTDEHDANIIGHGEDYADGNADDFAVYNTANGLESSTHLSYNDSYNDESSVMMHVDDDESENVDDDENENDHAESKGEISVIETGFESGNFSISDLLRGEISPDESHETENPSNTPDKESMQAFFASDVQMPKNVIKPPREKQEGGNEKTH